MPSFAQLKREVRMSTHGVIHKGQSSATKELYFWTTTTQWGIPVKYFLVALNCELPNEYKTRKYTCIYSMLQFSNRIENR